MLHSDDQCVHVHAAVSLLQVLKVMRVQNPMLWMRYCIRQHEMQGILGAAGNCPSNFGF
jgi:hypothetical protein